MPRPRGSSLVDVARFLILDLAMVKNQFVKNSIKGSAVAMFEH